MKFENPKMNIEYFDAENIVTASSGETPGNDPAAQAVFEAAGRNDVNVTGSVDVGSLFAIKQ